VVGLWGVYDVMLWAWCIRGWMVCGGLVDCLHFHAWLAGLE